jgi:O-antigen ligase
MFLKIANFLDHSYARNVGFAFFIGIFCVLLGGLATALFVASCFALIFINPKAKPSRIWNETKILCAEMPVLLCFPIFYALVVITSFRGDDWLQDVIHIAGSYWQFLFLLPATVGLYHLSRDVNFAGVFSYGCRLALLFVLPLSLIQLIFFNARADGFLNNSLVFASLCIIGSAAAIIEWPEDDRRQRILARVSFSFGLLAALLTFSRGMLIPILAVLMVALAYNIKSRSELKLAFKSIVLFGLFFLAIFFAALQTDNGWRFVDQRILQPIEMVKTGKLDDNSISHRLDMQRTGFHAFVNSPLLGYGIPNVLDETNSVSQEVLGRKTEYTYTHLHNDYLTHAVGGGFVLMVLFAIVIFTPFLVGWKIQLHEKDRAIFYFGAMITAAFSAIALTNIVFHNDQLTTMYSVATMFLIVRHYQYLNGVTKPRIPNLSIIANGDNPVGKEKVNATTRV